MKLLLSCIAALVLTVSSAEAHGRRDYYHHHRHHRNNDAPLIIGSLFGLLLLDSVIKSQNGDYERDEYTHPRRPRYYEHYCATEQVVDRYGNVYYRRICR